MLQGGMRTVDVARAINCNVCTVKCLRQHYRETGRTADHPCSSRPRVTPALDRYIRTSRLRDRYRMATTTARVTPGTHNPSIRAQTVCNRLIEEGLRSCRPVVKAGPHQTSPATTSPMGTKPPFCHCRQSQRCALQGRHPPPSCGTLPAGSS